MADLVTLDYVKTYLGLEAGETNADPVLKLLITAASDRFVALTNNPIVSAQYTEVTNGNGGRMYVPKRYPVLSVSALTIDGNAIPAIQSLGDTGYVVIDDTIQLIGYVFTSSRSTVYYSVWPTFSYSFGTGNVSLTYTAGYETIPAAVTHAVCEMVGLQWKGRDRIGLMSQSIGGETLSFQTLTLPESIDSIIRNFRRPRI